MQTPPIKNPRYGFWSLLHLHLDYWLEGLAHVPLTARMEAREQLAERELRLLRALDELERAKSLRELPPLSDYQEPR